jgi:hypothetical protein
MVNSEYDGSKVPPKVQGGQIRVTKEYGASLDLSPDDYRILQEQLQSQVICPPIFYFKDTPDVRRILRVE